MRTEQPLDDIRYLFLSVSPPYHASSLPPSLIFSLIVLLCQFCCVSVSHGSFWPTHGQTHSKAVQLISILDATFPVLTKLC